MARQKIANVVSEMVLPVVQEAGLELVDVEFVKEGGHWYLRVFIDKSGGVQLEDCQHVSEKVEKILDEKDPVPHSYFLEVSSPGIERPLKKPADYSRFAGKLANITTYMPFHGKKKIIGRIVGLRGDEVILEVDGAELPIPLQQVASARLEVEF